MNTQMLVFESIKNYSEEKFKRTVGISLPDFIYVTELISSFIEKEKQANPMKKRGLKSKLTIFNQVLLFFYYLRDYPTFLKLGQSFGISESYANKIFHRVLNILVQTLKLPNRKVLLDGDFEKILIDVTEQPIERPVKKQKDYYSGKKKDIPLRFR